MQPRRNAILSMAAALATTLLISGVTASDVLAGSCCGGGSDASKGAAQPGDVDCHSGQGAAKRQVNDPPFEAPHGGQLSKFGNYYEVVYGPQETRVYLYDMFRYPLAARAVQGDVVMRVRSTGREFRYPLQYVPAGNGQDHLIAQVDLTRVRDGDMDVRFDLRDVPGILTKTARFEQRFAISRRPEDTRVSRLPALQQPSQGRIAIQQRGAYPAPRVIVDRVTRPSAHSRPAP